MSTYLNYVSKSISKLASKTKKTETGDRPVYLASNSITD